MSEQEQELLFENYLDARDTFLNLPSPFKVRNDCQQGEWKLGDKDFIGNSLRMAIIGFKDYYGGFGIGKEEIWKQVFFIPAPNEKKLPKNTVCVTYVKTRSLDSFWNMMVRMIADQSILTSIVHAGFQQHKGASGTYYSVNWDSKPAESDEDKNFIKRVCDFIRTKPELMDLSLPPTMEKITGARSYLIESKSLEGDTPF